MRKLELLKGLMDEVGEAMVIRHSDARSSCFSPCPMMTMMMMMMMMIMMIMMIVIIMMIIIMMIIMMMILVAYF
jgi:hypothetical protein